MSKSYGNAIFLSDAPQTVSAKVAAMVTDPQRMRKSDPGNPDICNVYDFHKLYSPPEVVAQVNRRCRSADIGCVQCKQLMAQHLNAFLDPIRERRRFYQERPGLVAEIIAAGNDRARQTARQTMDEVRTAIKL
jgi:tryptophanyl-tRNA synthetase